MALVHYGISILDADGDTSTLAVKVPQGTLTLAELTEFGQELTTLVDAITEGKITEISMIVNLALPGGLTASPVANSNIQEGALFAFSAAGTPYRHSVRVPAFVQSKFAGKEVDLDDTQVAAFTAAMVSGLDASGTTVSPSNKHEEDLTAVLSGVKSFRR